MEKPVKERPTPKCKFCSSEMQPLALPTGGTEYFCTCENFTSYIYLSAKLKKLEEEYKKEKTALSNQLNNLAFNSDFCKKVKEYSNSKKEQEGFKNSFKKLKTINISELINYKNTSSELEKEIKEYHWFPCFF